jgi:DHA1 family tetracycline resistance protein-like MFS transporter
VFITLMLDVLGIGLIIPVAPLLVEQLQGDGSGKPESGIAVMVERPSAGTAETSAAAYAVGALGATYAAMQFVFAPVLGSLSDRWGRRPVILISLLGSGIDYLALALSPNLTWLFVTRAISGLTGANFTAASAYIADVTPPEKRAAGFGMLGAAFGMGFVLGPLLGGVLGAYSIRLPFIAAGVLTLANWLYGVFVLPESLPRERRRAFSWSRANPIGALASLRRYPLALGLACTMFLLTLAHFGLRAVWVLYTAHRYGWGPKQVGASLALVGVVSAVVQGGLTRAVVSRLGEPRALLMGMTLAVLQYVGYGSATQGWMIYAIIAAASIGAVAGPATQSLITRAVHADEQGEVQGALTSLQSIAGIAGPLVGSGLFGYFISEASPVRLPGAPFYMSAALALAGLAVAAAVLRRHAGEAK